MVLTLKFFQEMGKIWSQRSIYCTSINEGVIHSTPVFLWYTQKTIRVTGVVNPRKTQLRHNGPCIGANYYTEMITGILNGDL